MSIIFRGSNNQAEAEAEYIEKFANPFPAANRGTLHSLKSENILQNYNTNYITVTYFIYILSLSPSFSHF